MHFYYLLFGRMLRFYVLLHCSFKEHRQQKVQQKCIYESICANIQNKKI